MSRRGGAWFSVRRCLKHSAPPPAEGARCEVRGHLCHLHPLPSQLGLDGNREVPRKRCKFPT